MVILLLGRLLRFGELYQQGSWVCALRNSSTKERSSERESQGSQEPPGEHHRGGGGEGEGEQCPTISAAPVSPAQCRVQGDHLSPLNSRVNSLTRPVPWWPERRSSARRKTSTSTSLRPTLASFFVGESLGQIHHVLLHLRQ